MSKKHLHLKELEVPLYRGKLVIILTNDKEQLQKYIGSLDYGQERFYQKKRNREA